MIPTARCPRCGWARLYWLVVCDLCTEETSREDRPMSRAQVAMALAIVPRRRGGVPAVGATATRTEPLR